MKKIILCASFALAYQPTFASDILHFEVVGDTLSIQQDGSREKKKICSQEFTYNIGDWLEKFPNRTPPKSKVVYLKCTNEIQFVGYISLQEGFKDTYEGPTAFIWLTSEEMIPGAQDWSTLGTFIHHWDARSSFQFFTHDLPYKPQTLGTLYISATIKRFRQD